MAARAVFRVMPQDMNFGSLFDMFSVTFREPWVIQRFLPEVKHGDKRIMLVDGEFAGAVNRVPAADDLRSNMVRGGAAQGDRAVAARARDLRHARPGAARARPAVRRHRRDRRQSDRDQRHLADRHPRHRAARRPGRRGKDLGRHRGEAREAVIGTAAVPGRASATRRSLCIAHSRRSHPDLLPACRGGRSMFMAGSSGRRSAANNFKNSGGRRMTTNLSRRSLLAFGAGLGASTMLGGSALARAPKARHANALLAPLRRWRCRGHRGLRRPASARRPFRHVHGRAERGSEEDARGQLHDPDNVVLEQNSPVVNIGNKLVLFDTGMGTSKAFGPTTGQQQKNLAAAGIKPGDIDAVVCTHAHIDHIGGLVGADDKPLFPNAQVYITQSDYDYWTDEGKLGSPLKDFVIHARKNLLPVQDRLVFIKDGQEILPGIQAIAAPGHTVGHTIFMVTSEGKSFAFLGDLTHHSVLLMEKPRMEFSYDTDPKQSAASRVKLLDMLAANKIPVMSYHFAWPGYGHVAKAGRRFPLLSESR